MLRGFRFSVVAGAVALLTPSTAVAQAQGMVAAAEQRPMYELPSLSVVVSGATALDERAATLYQQGDWSDAAKLYRDAAEQMPDADPNSYSSYDMAARLYFYGDEYRTAREMMERAAEVAEATGDVVSAAYRHVDAAFIAVWEGYPGSRREHVSAAKALAGEEEFGEQHAQKIQALIHGVGALPMANDGDDGGS